MALTGKTIGQLTYLSEVTTDTLFPVELSGDTYHISYSAFTNSNYNEGTYNDLYSFATGGTLTAGSYYLMTDFQTCYDQPNFDTNGTPITIGNYKTGTTEPILLLAISTTGFSPTVYSTLYPQDKISYDITWNLTEVTSGPAKGRITERIDNFNNRTDYDHRTILFKRYRLFTYREQLNGTIELFSDGTVSGVSTSFNLLTVGDVVYSPNVSPSYFEIISISGNTLMTVSGDTLNPGGPGMQIYNTIEETNDSEGYFSYKQTNVKTDDYLEYTTFGDALDQEYAKNNYVGNYANNYTNIDSGTFILANNLFLEGQYESNKFGDYCYNNTFGTDNQNNIWGDFCYENVSVNDIDDNIIGHYFNRNLINVNLSANNIGHYFNNNRLLAENSDNFEDNIIGNNFNNNTIYSWFHDNEVLNDFENNTIGDFISLTDYQFRSNKIGNQFNNNTIYWDFIKNSILNDFNTNTIGGVDNLGLTFENNQIMNNFKGNNIQGDFWSNQIKTDFKGNDIFEEFGYNNIGFGCSPNSFSGITIHNNIGDNFSFNTCYGVFSYNTIGTYFNSNEVQDGFGFGGVSYQGNRIGNNFNDNTIGEYFYNNTIPDNFTDNTVGDYFQWNIVDTYIDFVDFTTNYGNISGITYSATGTTATDSSYGSIGGTTNGIGVNSLFQIDVVGGSVTNVSIISGGTLYSTGNTVTILGSQIGGTNGVDNVIITVSSVSQPPSVYEEYTCNIFKNSALLNRLSYYDGSDVLNIKNINE
jgi:hypothetical protein